MSKNSVLASLRRFSTRSRVLSAHTSNNRKTLLDIQNLYLANKPISTVTAHDFLTGRMVDKAQVDIALVGDSLAMTTLGYNDTNQISLDEFIYHVKSVSRSNKSSFIVADLPFGSFERSVDQAVDTSIRLIKEGGAQAIKIEGGNAEIIPTVEKLVSIGVPVIGHVGLTPQKHNALSGFNLQGNTTESALKIYDECLNLQKAGVFALLLECIPNKLAEYITANFNIPTIGIGAGPHVSGQVLVIADMLGMCDPSSTHIPKFVKSYDNFFERGVTGINSYIKDLESGQFPLPDEHGYKIKKEVLKEFKEKASQVKST